MVRRTLFAALLALGFLAFQPLSAYADFVPVPQSDPIHPNDDWTGSRSTPDASGEHGITGTGSWSQDNGGFEISWTIVSPQQSSSGYWEYTYTISDVDGSPLNPDFNLLILEVSPIITEDNVHGIIPYTSIPFSGPQLWQPPRYPLLYGISTGGWDPWVFTSTQAPVWGDFYAEDGVSVTAYNSDIGTDPGSTTTVFTGWIPVPDSGGGQIPEPSSLLLLTLGGCGVLASRLRRKP
jgi:hypothetical protein